MSIRITQAATRRLQVVATVGVALCAATSVDAQSIPFSTHDWTPFVTYFPNPTGNPFKETWADVKTPGGMPRFDFPPTVGGFTPDQRRTYCVGTIEVNTTLDTQFTFPGGWTVPAASFSGRPASTGTTSLPGFATAAATDRRQVVILQCNRSDRGTNGAGNPDPNGIVWQRYFYGLSGTAENPDFTHPTNARAVSVWAADANDDIRIAICGETWDQRLPLSQATGGWVGGAPTGFIAVYDGDGDLEWTYHFFAGTSTAPSCAVTDLSIRVDAEGNEIVTYCGVFTHGNPGAGTFLTPEKGFLSPATGLSSGSTTQASGQWDGFVGRLVHTGGSPGTTNRLFHSIVGGPGQDGLFGLAETTEERFAVVGSTAADTSQEGFPVFLGGAPLLTAPYQVGVALVFDACQTTATSPPTDLILDSSASLGVADSRFATIARDVCIGFDVGIDVSGTFTVGDVIYVVGSTNDDTFDTTAGIPFQVSPTLGQGAFGGGVADGFAAVFQDQPALLWPHTFAYWGGGGDDGLMGVNCWNEFSEHIAVVGFSAASTSANIGVTTFLLNNAYGPGVPSGSTAPPSDHQQLQPIRSTLIGGTSDDRPAVMGFVNATDLVSSIPQDGAFSTFQLNQPAAGGGVSVANDGRVDVVGRTNPTGGGYPVVGVNARAADLGMDAVRTEVDMVPPQGATQGVGRTDSTGFQIPGTPFPAPGYSGGTTPTCGLAVFGKRIGEADRILTRMLIDYEGTPPANGVNDAAIVVTRPPLVPGSLSLGILWQGFPATTIAPIINGVEFWPDPASWTILLDVWPGERSCRLPLSAMPSSGSLTVSNQFFCLFDPTPGTGPFGFTMVPLGAGGTGCATEWAASPVLWFTF